MAGVGSSGLPGLIHGELEEEWAVQCPRPAVVSNALHLPFGSGSIRAAVSSFTYGNRMADQYAGDAKNSTRYTYRIFLGRELHPDNSGQLQWGNDYRVLHHRVLAELWRVLAAGAPFILNMSNHIRQRVEEPVVEWFVGHMTLTGWSLEKRKPIPTPRQRNGQNGELRVEHEWLLLFRKPRKAGEDETSSCSGHGGDGGVCPDQGP